MNIELAFQQVAQKIFHPEKQYKIAIGYSGGVDSTVVLHLMAKFLAKKTNIKIEALTFLHGNTPLVVSNDEIKEHTINTCKELNISHTIVDLNLNVEDKGRQSWESIAHLDRIKYYQNQQYDYVFLGHHQNDQAETVMIQLLRGAGSGSSGMKMIDEQLIRPLLEASKQDVLNYANKHQIQWIEDPINHDLDYTRNFWRFKALPLLKEHYGESLIKRLIQIGDKNQKNKGLLQDLAKLDKVDELVKKQTLNLSHLPQDNFDDRFLNLMQNYCHQNHISYQESQWKELLKIMKSEQRKKIEFTIQNNNYFYDKKTQDFTIVPKFDLKLTKKNKM